MWLLKEWVLNDVECGDGIVIEFVYEFCCGDICGMCGCNLSDVFSRSSYEFKGSFRKSRFG